MRYTLYAALLLVLFSCQDQATEQDIIGVWQAGDPTDFWDREINVGYFEITPRERLRVPATLIIYEDNRFEVLYNLKHYKGTYEFDPSSGIIRTYIGESAPVDMLYSLKDKSIHWLWEDGLAFDMQQVPVTPDEFLGDVDLGNLSEDERLLIGSWKYAIMSGDGVSDFLDKWGGSTYSFDKKGRVVISYGDGTSESGTFHLSGKRLEISPENAEATVYQIIRLNDQELKLRQLDRGIRHTLKKTEAN